MVLKPILGYFLLKRKTRIFPYFIGVCELFTTILFILLATATCSLKSNIISIYSIYHIIDISMFFIFFDFHITHIISIICIINIYNLATNWQQRRQHVLISTIFIIKSIKESSY